MRICIATQSTYAATPWREDDWLAQTLINKGCSVDIKDWQSASDWLSYDAIFVSSTWNIPSDPDGFATWLATCEADGRKRMINDHAVLQLGIAKDSYWKVLEEAGDPVLTEALTPTVFLPRNQGPYSDYLEHCRMLWPEDPLVFKPIVSADSLNTYVYDPSATAQAHDAARILTNPDALDRKLQVIWSDERLRGVMAQPYQKGVEEGEISATFVGRDLVGAVQKQPGFGPLPARTRTAVTDTALLSTLAELGQRAIAAVAAQSRTPVRTRIDFIPQPEGMRILEVEMVDPNCNFSTLAEWDRTKAVDILAAAIITAHVSRITED